MTNITNFTALHDAMEGLLKKSITAVRTVDAYRADTPRDTILTPAILVGVEEMGQEGGVSGGRLAMSCAFSAYCLLSSKTKRAEMEIRNFAATVAMTLHGERFGLGEAVGRPSNITAVPGVFENDQPGLECWVVSWEQVVYLGSVWSPPDLVHDALHPGNEGTGAKPHDTGRIPLPNLDGGIWLEGCHPERHKLEDFPK